MRERLAGVTADVDATFAKHDARVVRVLACVDEASGGVGAIRGSMAELQVGFSHARRGSGGLVRGPKGVGALTLFAVCRRRRRCRWRRRHWRR